MRGELGVFFGAGWLPQTLCRKVGTGLQGISYGGEVVRMGRQGVAVRCGWDWWEVLLVGEFG